MKTVINCFHSFTFNPHQKNPRSSERGFFIQVVDLAYHWMYNSPAARYTFVYHHGIAVHNSFCDLIRDDTKSLVITIDNGCKMCYYKNEHKKKHSLWIIQEMQNVSSAFGFFSRCIPSIIGVVHTSALLWIEQEEEREVELTSWTFWLFLFECLIGTWVRYACIVSIRLFLCLKIIF